MATTSSSFGPASRPTPHNLIFLTTDSVLFYLHVNVLSRLSTNAFRTVIAKPSTSIAGCDEPVKRIPETSSVLEAILHILYRIPYTAHTPNHVETIVNAISSMRRYDIEPALHLTPNNPFYSSLIAFATTAPLDLYVIAAQCNLEHLAINASSNLLSLSLSDISDDLALKIGPIYLRRLVCLHEERMQSLKRILFLSPPSHTPTPECGENNQTKLASAWIMTAADLAWDAKPDFSATRIRSSFSALKETTTCPLCQQAVENRLEDAITNWIAVKRTI